MSSVRESAQDVYAVENIAELHKLKQHFTHNKKGCSKAKLFVNNVQRRTEITISAFDLKTIKGCEPEQHLTIKGRCHDGSYFKWECDPGKMDIMPAVSGFLITCKEANTREADSSVFVNL